MNKKTTNLLLSKQSRTFKQRLFRVSVVIALVFAIYSFTSFIFPNYTFADGEVTAEQVTETIFFGNMKDDGKGCGVFTILNLILEILSIGIGILGVIGIMVVGIQYMTAADNEQQTAKAKRRIAEIIIGLIAYAILYAASQWLLPGGFLNTDISCKKISDDELVALREEKRKAREAAIAKATNYNKGSKVRASSSSTANSSIAASTVSGSIAKAAKLLSWPAGTSSKQWKYGNKQGVYSCCKHYPKVKSWKKLTAAAPVKAFQDAYDEVRPNHWTRKGSFQTKSGADCGQFVKVVLLYVQKHGGGVKSTEWEENSEHWKQMPKGTKAKPGDVCSYHRIYVSGGYSAEAANHNKEFGHLSKTGSNCGGGYTIYRYKK